MTNNTKEVITLTEELARARLQTDRQNNIISEDLETTARYLRERYRLRDTDDTVLCFYQLNSMASDFRFQIKMSDKLTYERGVTFSSLDANWSGTIVAKNAHPNRARFILVHEISHIILGHETENIRHEHEQRMKDYGRSQYELHKYTLQKVKEEDEANYLAGAILMPFYRFREDVYNMHFDVDKLAEKYGVTYHTAAHRMCVVSGLKCHFLKINKNRQVEKPFSNDGSLVPPRGAYVCAHSASAKVLETDGPETIQQFSYHIGIAKPVNCKTFFCTARRIEDYSVTFGFEAEHAKHFPGWENAERVEIGFDCPCRKRCSLRINDTDRDE